MKHKSIREIVDLHAAELPSKVYGRLVSVRDHGKIVFLDVADDTGSLQVVVKNGSGVDIEEIKKINPGSYLSIDGTIREHRGQHEIHPESVDVLAQSTLRIDPAPWSADALDPRFGEQVLGLTSFYVSNPKRMAVLSAKANFVKSFHEYFSRENFMLVEPPIITDKTLYDESSAISVDVHGERAFLSQCATFELEPLAMAFRKVYTISPAFRNEKGGSKRHLAEYTHAKAEVLLADLEDLIELAGESIYTAVSGMVERSESELSELGVEVDFAELHPSRHERISYDEAIRISRSLGSTTELGDGLTHRDEKLITSHLGDKYVWVMFPPFASEGFPYKRNPDNRDQSMVADLIAPNGAGEMVGVAEKVTCAGELIENLIEKGKRDTIHHYWEYILLRRAGLPAHGGMGAAPERIVYGMLDIDHIKFTKPWPRYPGRKINPVTTELRTYGDGDLERLMDSYGLRETAE